MRRLTRKQREAEFAEMALKSLKDHVILKGSEEGRWQIGRANGSSIYRAEILVTFYNSLIVHGDVDLVNFQSYSSTPSTLETARNNGPGGAREARVLGGAVQPELPDCKGVARDGVASGVVLRAGGGSG